MTVPPFPDAPHNAARHMRKAEFLILLVLAAPLIAQTRLACSNEDGGSRAELEAMKKAPHGAKRVGKHRLIVNWSGGQKAYDDQAPYLEGELDGRVWVYCGYNEKTHMHLIEKNDGGAGVFSGVLLNDQSGVTLDAGQKVLFSDDGSLYAATFQPDGQDGETLRVRSTLGGAAFYEGYNGITRNNGKYDEVVTEFENLRWDKQNRLLADGKIDGKIVIYSLARHKDGQWKWVAKK